ncbi:MAG: TerB family tellurite resistance protein [Spirulina sp. SIO3F2]|nr:TerB family tellurite resistance protein [Spirulina sp. SIO3F2]
MTPSPINATQTKALLKILMGAAWLDGVIQPEERQYLHTMAQNNQLDQDPDIKKLLSEAQPIAPAECMQWITAYLRQYHTEADYQALLEALSALIYSDGDVQVEEAKVLMQVQGMAPQAESESGMVPKVLKSIQMLYKRAVQNQS